uniref:Uncharacterized protein n=1 Tax=Utricularia reniformis TaxID=192314 RepID=A0A1Y0AYP7_9LAMI|nr:hypothetical protein AEK19_MT0354 [Utricularia reniformis]ART30275.1 hypothetical protein AEK19_MT0354 [Utricularia reniformis]
MQSFPSFANSLLAPPTLSRDLDNGEKKTSARHRLSGSTSLRPRLSVWRVEFIVSRISSFLPWRFLYQIDPNYQCAQDVPPLIPVGLCCRVARMDGMKMRPFESKVSNNIHSFFFFFASPSNRLVTVFVLCRQCGESCAFDLRGRVSCCGTGEKMLAAR